MTNTLSKKAQKALALINDGAYFTQRLETQFNGQRKFIWRMFSKDHSVIKGYGFKTYHELKDNRSIQI